MSATYAIEKGVPIPTNVKSARTKYPLELLNPGDSFFIPAENGKQVKNLRSSMAVRAKKLGFTIATLADDTGVRVWRTL
jgi:hypothetical protein